MIAALFVQRGGVYWDLEGVDPWDEARDARLYAGPWPVVAHPPCARWCLLAPLVEKTRGRRVGDDGGCFESALHSVRTFGGVLEHPAFTLAFPRFGLPIPRDKGGWQRGLCGGWSCHVNQWHFGHRAKKPTWLYAFGVLPPAMPWGPPPADADLAYVTDGGGYVARANKPKAKFLTHRERSATPLPFRDLLLSIARSARQTEAA